MYLYMRKNFRAFCEVEENGHPFSYLWSSSIKWIDLPLEFEPRTLFKHGEHATPLTHRDTFNYLSLHDDKRTKGLGDIPSVAPKMGMMMKGAGAPKPEVGKVSRIPRHIIYRIGEHTIRLP